LELAPAYKLWQLAQLPGGWIGHGQAGGRLEVRACVFLFAPTVFLLDPSSCAPALARQLGARALQFER